MFGGLKVALLSLLQHARFVEPVKIRVVCHRFSELHKAALARICARAESPPRLDFVEFEPRQIITAEHLGTFYSVTKLRLPDLLPEVDKALYLDCDVVVQQDVSALLLQADVMSGVLAAVEGGPAINDLDWPAYAAAGMTAETPVFNAGVLLLNLARWRSDGVQRQLQAIPVPTAALVRSGDQGLLNLLARGEFERMPADSNRRLHPRSSSVRADEKGVFHFIGAPKPFDPLGCLLNRNWPLYRRYARQLEQAGDPLHPSPLLALKRIWRIRRSYVRAMLRTVMRAG